MGLLLLPIPITLIPIQATCRERLWRGVRELRWVPLLGALGGATGAIVIGTVATSTSTTTIISIGITTRPSTGVKLARATTGSTIRNIAETLRMGIGRLQINMGAQLEARVADRRVRELELGPVAVPEPELVQVAAEREPVPVVVVLALGPVVAEAVPVPSQPLAQVVEQVLAQAMALELVLVRAAVALRTKSVTAAHRRDLVLRLAAEDLAAAAAETTREPAAAEAVIAWEVAE